jgi:hypothetical protein
MNKIGIILTSIERPQALKKSVESIIANWQENWVLLVGLQDYCESESYQIMKRLIINNYDKHIRVYNLDYDCGISKARNELIQKANLWDCKYTLLTADSITFDESIKRLQFVISSMEVLGYDLCGLNLNNRISWEAKLTLKQNKAFELDFIDPKEKDKHDFVDCSIVRNFWIAKTEVLLQVPYDNDLIMCEHEDFFWRMQICGKVICCTNLCSGTYNRFENTPKYDEIRANNFRIGKQRLIDKYSLKSWITYKNIERTKI